MKLQGKIRKITIKSRLKLVQIPDQPYRIPIVEGSGTGYVQYCI